MRILGFAAAAAMTLTLAAPAYAGVTFVGGSIQTDAVTSAFGGSNVGGTSSGSGSGLGSANLIAPPDAQDIGSSATSTSKRKVTPTSPTVTTAQAESDSFGWTTLSTADEGSIRFQTETSATVNASAAAGANAQAYGQSSFFYYDFLIDAASDFTFDYDLFDTNGLNSKNITLFDYTSGANVAAISQILATNSSGSLTASLSNLGKYRLSINSDYGSFGGLVTQTGVGAKSGSRDDIYHFSIVNTAVPEPMTWALMIAGFGMTGAALRRRRESAALA